MKQEQDDTRIELATVAWSPLMASIVGSSIWSLSDPTRIVWITMLAMKNKRGYVDLSLCGLARMANVPLEAAREAVRVLESPDLDSRDTKHEGRRIRPVIGSGWVILNFEKYRVMAQSSRRRDYLRDKKREARARARELEKNGEIYDDSKEAGEASP